MFKFGQEGFLDIPDGMSFKPMKPIMSDESLAQAIDYAARASRDHQGLGRICCIWEEHLLLLLEVQRLRAGHIQIEASDDV